MRAFERRLASVAFGVGVSILVLIVTAALLRRGDVQLYGYAALFGLALIVGSIALNPEGLVSALTSRRLRGGTMSALLATLGVGALLVLNTAAAGWNNALDLTRGRLYTLAPQSVTAVRHLTSDLTVIGFYTPAQANTQEQMRELLSLYQQQSAHVRVRFVDPTQNPVLATQLGVTAAGDLVLEYRSRAPQVLPSSAQAQADITSAILRLESNHPLNVCWEAGEGERDYQDATNPTGYGLAAQLLQADNFNITQVALSQLEAVPASCDVLAVVGGNKPLDANASRGIEAYLQGGGKLLVAFDPWVSSDDAALKQMNLILKPWGFYFGGGLVEEGDPNRMAVGDPTTPVAFQFGSSPIAKALTGQYVFMPQPTPIYGIEPTGVTAVNLVVTSASAFNVQTPRSSLARAPGDGGGPFTLMETMQDQASNATSTRIAMIGTSGFAENRALPPNANGGNGSLLTATFQWLAQQDSLISIGAQPTQPSVLSLTQGQLQFNYLLTLVALPLLVLAAGTAVWWHRRAAATD